MTLRTVLSFRLHGPPASHRLLFHTISLGVVDRSRTKNRKRSGTHSFLHQFHQLDEILDKSPYIAEQCIRCVNLRFKSYSADPDTTAFGWPAGFVLAQVLARLGRVQEFSLSLGYWASYPHEAKDLIYGAALPFLRKVKFSLTVLNPAESSVRFFDWKIRESFVAVSARPGTLLEVSVEVTHIYF